MVVIEDEINKACELPEGTTVNKFTLNAVLEEVERVRNHMDSVAAMIANLKDGEMDPEFVQDFTVWSGHIRNSIGRFKRILEAQK